MASETRCSPLTEDNITTCQLSKPLSTNKSTNFPTVADGQLLAYSSYLQNLLRLTILNCDFSGPIKQSFPEECNHTAQRANSSNLSTKSLAAASMCLGHWSSQLPYRSRMLRRSSKLFSFTSNSTLQSVEPPRAMTNRVSCGARTFSGTQNMRAQVILARSSPRFAPSVPQHMNITLHGYNV